MTHSKLDRVTEYAKSVVSGEVVAGELHRLACQRHLDDLERGVYVWDVEASERAIQYAETLTIVEGVEERSLKLEDSQAFDMGVTFGWYNQKGFRRFRRRYISMARQNGKSMTNGVTGTYIAGFSGYKHGKLFTVATKKRQARIAWEEMSKFVQADEDLGEFFDIKDYKSLIVCNKTKCTIEALSKEAGLDDGFRSIFSSIDELHQHKDNKVYKAIYNGTRALDETLVSMITTRGDNINTFCKEMDDYCIKVLKGLVTADDFFVDIYALDQDDDPWDEANWIKSNPFLATTERGMEQLRTDAQTAKDMGGADMRDFLTKSLNLWVQNTDDSFINADAWKECASERTLEDFRGAECCVGLDLSSGGDLTSFALEFVDNGKYYFFSHSFMPRGRMQEHIETDLAPYDLWENMELLTVTGGDGDFKNDYKFIIKTLAELKDEYDLSFSAIGIDPHNADGILADLEEFGCPVIVVQQSARALNDATVDIQLLTKSKAIEYNVNNELLSWSFLNARVVRNSFDEIKVDKKARQRFKRIDPVDACVDAHYCVLKNNIEKEIDTGSLIDDYLSAMGWN